MLNTATSLPSVFSPAFSQCQEHGEGITASAAMGDSGLHSLALVGVPNFIFSGGLPTYPCPPSAESAQSLPTYPYPPSARRVLLHATALALAQSVARAELRVVHHRSPPDAATHAVPGAARPACAAAFCASPSRAICLWPRNSVPPDASSGGESSSTIATLGRGPRGAGAGIRLRVG